MNKKKISIIGAGPAGLSASICLSRLKVDVTIFSGGKIGGQLYDAVSVDNFIGLPGIFTGPEIIEKMERQVLMSEYTTLVDKTINAVDFSKKGKFYLFLDDGNIFETNAIIIATGKIQNKLNVNNVKKYIGHGLSYCVLCDAPFFKNKIVAVVGSGDSAIKGALHLAQIASKVYIFIRGEIIKASTFYSEKISNYNNIIVKYNTSIEGINGEDFIEEVTIKEKNILKNIKLDGLFVLIGSGPSTDVFKDYISIDDKGYIVTDAFCKTNIEGIFAAGDVQANTFKQAPIAIGNGYTAGISAFDFISKL